MSKHREKTINSRKADTYSQQHDPEICRISRTLTTVLRILVAQIEIKDYSEITLHKRIASKSTRSWKQTTKQRRIHQPRRRRWRRRSPAAWQTDWRRGWRRGRGRRGCRDWCSIVGLWSGQWRQLWNRSARHWNRWRLWSFCVCTALFTCWQKTLIKICYSFKIRFQIKLSHLSYNQ